MAERDTVSVTAAGPAPRRVRLASWLAAAAAVLAVASCSTGTDAVDQSTGGQFRFVAGTGKGETIPAAQRKQAPAVTGLLLGGGEFDLAAQRGNVVVLNFWASWCAPCRVESPEFDQVYRQTRQQGVEFVGVNIKDLKSAASEFVRVHKISYPSVYDQAGKLTLAFRKAPSGLPYTIVMDKQGRVAAFYVTPLLAGDITPVVQRLAEEP